MTTNHPIAIIGIGCRFPGGVDSPEQLWSFLCNRGNAITEVPKERWDVDALFAADPAAPGRTYARRGGFLQGIDHFDPEFFGISPREAAHMDPQQRLLLETAHEAMEDAGERWENPQVRSTGVFVGVFIHDYQHMQFADRDLLGAHTGTGTAMSITANRISYAFDLRGPSVAVDTACSSSLVAVDMACRALRSGECDYALAGGVNVILKPEMTIAMSKATMLSKEGTCKSFDARADGYVRGEGAGVVLLRRLPDAQAARNRIYAVIRGSGVNSDGRTKGISVPNGDAQEALAKRVLAEAGVPAHSIDYVEAHGTGTPVGDPIEANAIGRVFVEGRSEDDPKLLLGSIKTNIGHLESASGVAGLIKVALSLNHAEIPPNLHFQRANPAIDFEGLNLEVVQHQTPWPKREGPKRAAVNSFGFGGTNAHVLLEEAPHVAHDDAPQPAELPPFVLPMGAHDPAALRGLARGYADVLARGASAGDLTYTVSQHRSHGACRAALVAQGPADLLEGLRAFADGESPAWARSGRRIEGFAGKPVFVYTGMGTQWWAMGRELLGRDSVFTRAVHEVDELFQRLAGWSVVERLLASEQESLIQQTHVAQPAIFAVQVGLTALWRHWGVEPAAIIGHSVGEAAALHAAGVLTLEDAVTVIYHRSRLQRTTAGTGGMLAAGIDLEEALRLLKGRESRVAIGAINGPASLTLAGDVKLLEELAAELEAAGKFARMLAVEVPYHSPMMEVIRAELLSSLDGIAPLPATVPYYSTIDRSASLSALGGAAYWWRNVRQTVLFAQAMDAALSDGHAAFLEIGPHPALRTSIQECMTKHKVEGHVVGSLRRGQSDFDTLAFALAELHVLGVDVRWDRVGGTARRLDLPAYPWQRARHWSESEQAEQYRKGLTVTSSLRAGAQRHPLLGCKLELAAPTWLSQLRLREASYVRDHKVQGTVVFPGTGYLEMALQTLAGDDASSSVQPGAGEYLLLSDVEIGRALYMGDEDEAKLETTRSGDRWAIHGASGNDAAWVRHASGRCRRESYSHEPSRLDLEATRARCGKSLPADYAYRLFRDVGLEYGPAFQAIQELWYGPQEALARLDYPAALTALGGDDSPFLFHPALFDACLHTLFGALNLNGEDSDRRGNVFLPVSVRQLRIYRQPEGTLYSHAQLHTRASQHFQADVRVYDAAGQLVAEVLDLRCQALEHPASVAEKRRRDWMLEYQWQELTGGAPAKLDGRWLLFVNEVAHPLCSSLQGAGAVCEVAVPGSSFNQEGSAYTVRPSSPEDFTQLLERVTEGGEPLRGIVHAWADGENESAPAEFAEQTLGAVALIHLVKALDTLREREEGTGGALTSPTLWAVTRDAQIVEPGDLANLAHSTVWGLRRVIANEHPRLSARAVDCDGRDESWRALVGELATPPLDDELALRAGKRFVHRLQRYVPEEAGQAASAAHGPGAQRMELSVHKRGDLKSMGWIKLPPFELADHEVEIEVHATGLNFKDVMKATGLFPERLIEGNLWSRETIGMECAGRICRLGAGVTRLRVGDQVLALAPRTFASHAVTHQALVMLNPGVSPAEGAGIPVAYLTAAVALEQMAQLQPGERVLIHAASGGVGQAAIQLAHSLGAEVFATAGSEAKRQLVRNLGVKHVFDSRSLRFAEDIRAATGGEGVDVVLNSLAGEAITQSLSVLRDYGRFVEIGKMDLDRDFPLGLRPFTRCLSFHAVDLDRMLAQKPEACGRVLESLRARLADGRLRALPVTTYPAAHVAEAFYEMASAKHTGKLVVDLAAAEVRVQESAGVSFRRDASYIITGGLGGFGFELALWMAEHGAGHLVLLGRRGEQTPGAASARARLEALGSAVSIVACDVASSDDVARVLSTLPARQPLRGVFHAAAVLDDALLKNLDSERYGRTFGPKVGGAWNLHEQTLGCELDYFMSFSSMASVLGNQGSANYCAANAFVDALAHHRRRLGLPALTVNWGVIADVGMAADEDFYRQNLERNGLTTIHSRHCLELLGLLLQKERVQTTVCPIDFDVWLRFNPAGKEARLLALSSGQQHADVVRSQAAEEIALRKELDSLSPEAQEKLAQDTVQRLLAQVFRTELAKVEVSRSLTALGADSLMAIEIKNRLEALGLAMSVTQLLNRNSVQTLASALLDALGYSRTGTPAVAATPSAGTSSWLVQREPRPSAKVRLFCFPYAGGGPAVYHRWPESLPDWVDVQAINLPGRGSRTEERNLESIAAAADQIVPEILGQLDRPFALFGHCMGAILMYEVAQRLQQHGKEAVHIFASGCMAPHLYNSPVVHEQADDAFLDVLRLISFSGTRALIEDPELRKTTFPLLRGDFRAVVEYGCGFKERPALGVPITGLVADHDLFAAPKAMEAWDGYTQGSYELYQIRGDHYFVESDREAVTGLVAERLARSLGLEHPTNTAGLAAWQLRALDDHKLGKLPAPKASTKARHSSCARPDDGSTHVLCFPPAGVRASEVPLPRDATGDFLYSLVEWRGAGDVLPRTVDAMVDHAYQVVRRHRQGPVLFYGHCLGAIVAYELALRLQHEGEALPQHLLVAGVVGPHLYVAPDAHALPEPKLLELLHVLRFPLVERLRSDARFRAERLPLLRADLEAMASYQYRERDPLAAPITAISLRHDLWSYPLRTGSWSAHTSEHFSVVEWPGDHYETLRHPERVHALLRTAQACAVAAE